MHERQVKLSVHLSAGGGHDRDAANDDRNTAVRAMTTPTLAAALDHLRLKRAIFLRGEYTEAWAYESPTGEMMAGLLRPGRERLLYFHIIASGKCWVAIEGGEPHWAERGDVVVLPYGHQHRMGGEAERCACRSWSCSPRRHGPSSR